MARKDPSAVYDAIQADARSVLLDDAEHVDTATVKAIYNRCCALADTTPARYFSRFWKLVISIAVKFEQQLFFESDANSAQTPPPPPPVTSTPIFSPG